MDERMLNHRLHRFHRLGGGLQLPVFNLCNLWFILLLYAPVISRTAVASVLKSTGFVSNC